MMLTLNVVLSVMLFTAISASNDETVDHGYGLSPIKAGHTYVLLTHNGKLVSQI